MADKIPVIVTTPKDEDWIKQIDGGKLQAEDLAATEAAKKPKPK